MASCNSQGVLRPTRLHAHFRGMWWRGASRQPHGAATPQGRCHRGDATGAGRREAVGTAGAWPSSPRAWEVMSVSACSRSGPQPCASPAGHRNSPTEPHATCPGGGARGRVFTRAGPPVVGDGGPQGQGLAGTSRPWSARRGRLGAYLPATGCDLAPQDLAACGRGGTADGGAGTGGVGLAERLPGSSGGAGR